MENRQKGFIIPLLVTIIAVLAIGSGLYLYMQSKFIKIPQQTDVGNNISQKEYSTPTADTVRYIVVFKSNKDKTKTDIYIKNPAGVEKFFITLPDVMTESVNNADCYNGNLYIIVRPGGQFAYNTNPNWTDELWRYNSRGKGEKLYSQQGLTFKVSSDEKYIYDIVHFNKEGSILASEIISRELGSDLKKSN